MAKFPADHYPNSGIQHTRTIAALTVAQMCLEIYKPNEGTKIYTQMQKIKTAIIKCSTLTGKKKLSAGSKKALDNCCYSIAPFFDEISECQNQDNIYKRWGALMYCALTFVEDVIYTCPAYTTGIEHKKWDVLRSVMSEFCDYICQIDERIYAEGTMIYECAGWALDGVVFKPDDRKVFI